MSAGGEQGGGGGGGGELREEEKEKADQEEGRMSWTRIHFVHRRQKEMERGKKEAKCVILERLQCNTIKAFKLLSVESYQKTDPIFWIDQLCLFDCVTR